MLICQEPRHELRAKSDIKMVMDEIRIQKMYNASRSTPTGELRDDITDITDISSTPECSTIVFKEKDLNRDCDSYLNQIDGKPSQ